MIITLSLQQQTMEIIFAFYKKTNKNINNHIKNIYKI